MEKAVEEMGKKNIANLDELMSDYTTKLAEQLSNEKITVTEISEKAGELLQKIQEKVMETTSDLISKTTGQAKRASDCPECGKRIKKQENQPIHKHTNAAW